MTRLWRRAVAEANGRYDEFVKRENEKKKFGIRIGNNFVNTMIVAFLNLLFPDSSRAQFTRYLIFFAILGYFRFSIIWPIIFVVINVIGPLLSILDRKLFRESIQMNFDPEELKHSKFLNDIIEKFWSKVLQHRYEAHYVNLANKYLASGRSPFRMVRLDFGDGCPLTISGINVVKDVDDENEDDIVYIPKINAAFGLQMDGKMEFSLGPNLTFGFSRLTVNAVVELYVDPPRHREPGEAETNEDLSDCNVRLVFQRRPDLDFVSTGLIKLLNFPIFKSICLSMATCLWPRVVSLHERGRTKHISSLNPIGILQVTLVGANNLIRDRRLAPCCKTARTSVSVTLGNRTFRSALTPSATSHPRWNLETQFAVTSNDVEFNSLIVNIEEGNLLGSEDEEKLKVIETAIISVSDLLRDSEHAKDEEDVECRYSVLGQEVIDEEAEAERKQKEEEAEKKFKETKNVFLRRKLARHPERESREHCHVVTRPIFRRIVSDAGKEVSSGILVVNVPFISDSFSEELELEVGISGSPPPFRFEINNQSSYSGETYMIPFTSSYTDVLSFKLIQIMKNTMPLWKFISQSYFAARNSPMYPTVKALENIIRSDDFLPFAISEQSYKKKEKVVREKRIPILELSSEGGRLYVDLSGQDRAEEFSVTISYYLFFVEPAVEKN